MNISNNNKSTEKIVRSFFSKNLIISILICMSLVLVPGYVFVIRPQMNLSQELSNAINKYQADFVAQSSENFQAKKSGEFLSKITDLDKEKMNKILPSTSDQNYLFYYMDRIVKNRGLVMNNIDIADKDVVVASDNTGAAMASANNFKLIKITMSVAGADYTNFKNLLRDIENDTRLFDISKMNFDPSSSSLNLEMITYYQ